MSSIECRKIIATKALRHEEKMVATIPRILVTSFRYLPAKRAIGIVAKNLVS